MSGTIRPLGTNVLLQQDNPETESEGGIIIPDKAQEAPGRGCVLSVGKDVTEVKDGDIVMFNKWETTPVQIEGKDWVVVDEEKILVVIELIIF